MTNLQKLIANLTDMQVATIAKANNTQAVAHWRKGGTPRAEALVNLADHFKKTVKYLLQESKSK